MNAQSTVAVTAVLMLLLAWLLRIFVEKKISSGQTLFWLFPLATAQLFALFPSLIDRVSVLWGNLVPVSWITFAAMVLLIVYLLHLTIRLNRSGMIVDLARSLAYMEKRLRETESRCQELSERLARTE